MGGSHGKFSNEAKANITALIDGAINYKFTRCLA
jgi:hypothetical protein